MRKFSKMLAFALAAAMVFTAFAPAAKADAAEKAMAINKQGKILYLTDGTGINDAGAEGVEEGKGNVSEYDFAVSNKPADYKEKYTFQWFSSDPDVITVGKAGLTKAVGVGTADVMCLVTDKATGDYELLKNTITVKANADKVAIKAVKVNGTEVAAEDLEGLTVEVGAVVDLDREMTDAAGNKTTKRGEFVTDYTRWVVTDADGKDASDVVTVDAKKGQFTFTEKAAAGKYFLYCETYQSSKYPKATATSDKIAIEVAESKAAITDIKQNSVKTFTINFDKAVATLGNVAVERVFVDADFSLAMDVEKAELAKDGMSATVTLFGDLVDKTLYNVKVDGFDVMPLNASVGKVETIKLYADAKNVDAAVEPVAMSDDGIKIYYALYDANEVDVTSDADGYVEFSIDDSADDCGVSTEDGYGLIWMEKEGKNYVVTAEYQPADNEDNDPALNKKTTKQFVGYKEAAPELRTVKTYTINGDFEKPATTVAFPGAGEENAFTLKMNYSVAKGATVLKDPITEDKFGDYGFDGDIEVREITPDVAAIDDEGKITFFQYNKDAKFAVYYVYETEDGSDAEKFLKVITLKATDPVKLDKIELDANNFTLGDVDPYDNKTVTVKAKDNYGNPDTLEAAVEITGLDDNSKKALAALEEAGLTVVDGDKINLSGEEMIGAIELKSGRTSEKFSFEVKSGNFKTTLTFTVKVATGKESIEIKADGFGKDIARTIKDTANGSNGAKSATFEVIKTQNGVQSGIVEKLTPYVKDMEITEGAYYFTITKDGTDVTNKIVAMDRDVTTGKITINFSGVDPETGNVTYDLGAGKYEFKLFQGVVKFKKLALKDVTDANGTVTCNLGSYTYVGKASDDVEGISDAAILAALKIKNIKGDLVTAENASEYEVTVRDAEKYVYVESVTFYDEVGENEYAKYVVPVGVSFMK